MRFLRTGINSGLQLRYRAVCTRLTKSMPRGTPSSLGTRAHVRASDEPISVALARHLAWQQRLLEQTKERGALSEAVSFLVLRPGDKLTVCSASGMQDVRGRCWKGSSPPSLRRRTVHAEASSPAEPEAHWDVVMTSGRRRQLTRPVPGLGNIALSLVSAVVTAIVSRRVLQVENWTMAAESFGEPMPALLLDTSGWMPYVAGLQASGASVDSFAAHDDSSGFGPLCADDLRRRPRARLWRIFSNQYFLPLLLLNPHHAAQVEAMGAVGATRGVRGLRAVGGTARGVREGVAGTRAGTVRRLGEHAHLELGETAGEGGAEGGLGGSLVAGTARGPGAGPGAVRRGLSTSRRRGSAAKRGRGAGRGAHGRPGAAGGDSGGLWGPALRGLMRPQPRLLAAAAAYVARSGLGLNGSAVLGLHARSGLEAPAQRERLFSCARARLKALNASAVFLATMARRTRAQVGEGLRGDARVLWYGEAVGVQGESKRQLDAALLDLWLLGSASDEILISRGSTYSYVAHGLGKKPATIYGASHNSAAAHGTLAECARVPTAEPSFHLLQRALGRPECRAGLLRAGPLFKVSSIAY